MLLLQVVDLLFWMYILMLMARILGSWIPEFAQTRFMQFLSFYTDPYLLFFRRLIPPLGFLDISPIIAFICLSIIEYSVKGFILYLIR